MSKTLTLSLNKKLIIEAVKADTYITGAIDKSADAVKNSALAYNEQAGDDTYHERKLSRTLAGAVGSLEANLAEFVDTAENDGITDTLAAAGDDGGFSIIIKVSERYNNGLAYPIAQLSQEYIVNKMLYYWWQSIRPALAKDYLAFSAESLTNIRLCLAKTAPLTSEADYEDVSGEVSGAGGSSTTTVETAAYTNSKFQLTWSTISAAYLAGGLKISCTDPGVKLTVKIGSGDPLFTIGSVPHTISQSEYLNISSHIGETAKVDFIPASTPGAGAVLIATSKASS